MRRAAAAFAAFGGLVLTGALSSCAAAPLLLPSGGSSIEAASESASPSASASPSKPPSLRGNIDKSDIVLKVKQLSQKCYGYGIGCNVTYRVVVKGAYMDDWPKHGDVEVSYRVVGPEDGPESNTFNITLDDGQYEKPWEESTSTRSRGVKMRVRVTKVEYSK